MGNYNTVTKTHSCRKPSLSPAKDPTVCSLTTRSIWVSEYSVNMFPPPPGSVLLCSPFRPSVVYQSYCWGCVRHTCDDLWRGSWPARRFPVSSNNHNEWLGKRTLRSFVFLSAVLLADSYCRATERACSWNSHMEMCFITGCDARDCASAWSMNQ